MKKNKIAFLSSHLIQYQAPLFSSLAKEQDIDLTVYLCHPWGFKKDYDRGFDQKVQWDIDITDGFDYVLLRNFGLGIHVPLFGLFNPGIVCEITRGKYDAIIINGWMSLTNWLAYFTALATNTKVLFRCETPFNQEGKKHLVSRVIKKIMLRLLFAGVHRFLFIGKQNREFYKYHGVSDDRLLFCPYAVDNERFEKECDKSDDAVACLRSEFNIAKDAVVFLFVGKLSSKKRPFDLLEAYKDIQNERKSLVFVGDGILRKYLESVVKKENIPDVYFLGFQNQKILPRLYGMADVCVLPSGMGETWGLVINEAMLCSLPIITTSIVGSQKDLVRHGVNGYVYSVGDLHALRSSMESLMQDDERRKSFGVQSRAVIAHYTFKNDVFAIKEAVS